MALEWVNEQSSCNLSITFYDHNDALVTPTGGTYRIDDIDSGTEILDISVITPTTTSYTVSITATQNRIIDTIKESERRRVTFTWDYDSGSRDGTGEYIYIVKNLVGI